MKKLLLLLPVFLIPFLAAIAQTNYRAGYIILVSGDTVRGEIDYRNWDVNPENVFFRQNNSAKKYTVSQLLGFTVAGEDIYRTYNVTYHLSPSELNDAGKNFGEEVESKSVFLRLLYNGPSSVYQFKTKKREYFFLDRGGGEIKELIYRVKLVEGQFIKDEQYKNMLKEYIHEDNRSSMEKILEKTEYRQQDIVLFFTLLYKNVPGKKDNHRVRSQKDISAGMSLFSFYADKANPYYLHSVDFNASAGFKISGGLTFSSERNLARFQSRVSVGLCYTSLKGKNPVATSSSRLADFNSYFFTIEPAFTIGLVLNPLGKTKNVVGLELGYHFVVSNNLGIQIQEPGGAIVKQDIPANGGFMEGSLYYFIQGAFGRIGLQAGLLTNLLDVPTGRLDAKKISLVYGFVF